MLLFKLILASLFSRKWMVFLTCFSIAISILVLASVTHIESQLKQNFERSVSGVDLIVGSRTSQLNLLLFSIFRIGYPSNNLAWQSYLDLSQKAQISWAVPIVLGDSHQGYAVVGTTVDYFEHVKFANHQTLAYQHGQSFQQASQLVLGAAVAKDLGYGLGEEIILSHGAGKVSFTQHRNHPFKVVGILQITGTPVDKAIYMPIDAVDSLHEVQVGRGHETHQAHDAHPNAISAVLLGVSNKINLLSLQQNINKTAIEPLTAILPGVALGELWQIMSVVETSLKIIAFLVLIASMIGMTTMLLASMRERQQELVILRALGARPWVLILLLEAEAIFITLFGCLLGYAFLFLTLSLSQPYLMQRYAFSINAIPEIESFFYYAGLALGLALLLGLVPALLSYRNSVAKGLRFS